MSMRYEVKENFFVHRIRPEPVGEVANTALLHERRQSSNNSRGVFRTLWNTFTSCSPFPERHVVDVPRSIELVECNWSKRVMIDSIEERNIRLTACYIPNLKLVINYLNAVRKHQGKPHSEIEAAEQELPQSTRKILDSNYTQVMAGHSIAAFEEAIVIHEVLMFEGVHAIPSFHPKLDHTTQSPRSEESTVSEALSINTSPKIDGIQFLQMLDEGDVKTAYHLLEAIRQEQSGTPTFDDDVTYIAEKLNTPENDISYFVALILRNGRQNDFSSRCYQKHLLPHKDRLKRPRYPLATPHEESSRSEPVYPPQWADIIPSPRGTRCGICYDDIVTTFETTCCHLYLCLDCVSNNIKENNKAALENWINRHQMIECLQCKSPIKLGVHEQELSEAAQRILSHFHQQYIANLYLTHSNGIPVFCDDDNCREVYTINRNKLYFQCDNIERHADQRVKLHHSLCETLWTPDHHCPYKQEKHINDQIKNIKYMIKNINYIKPCIGIKTFNCKALIEKTEGCCRIECILCRTVFCWICEKRWSEFHNVCNNNRHEFSIRNRDQRRKQLNLTLATLQKKHQQLIIKKRIKAMPINNTFIK